MISNGQATDTEPQDSQRLTTEHAALARDINDLATSLGEIDSRSAGRMRDLAHAVSTPSERARWNAVDLRHAFNIERLSHEYGLARSASRR